MSEVTQPSTRLRASLANAAFAVEDRVAIGGAEVARGVRELGERARKLGGRVSAAAAEPAFDAVKWPFDRLAWGFQRHLLWPLQDRTDGWSQTTRRAGAAGVGVVALGACALGLVLASGGSNSSTAELAAATAPPPVAPVSDAGREGAHRPGPARRRADVQARNRGEQREGGRPKRRHRQGQGLEPCRFHPGTPRPGDRLGRRNRRARRTGGAEGGASLRRTHSSSTRSARERRRLAPPSKPRRRRSLLARCCIAPRGCRPTSRCRRQRSSTSSPRPRTVASSRSASRSLRVGVTSELRLNMQRQGKQPGNGPAGNGPAAGKTRPSQNSWRVTEVTG